MQPNVYVYIAVMALVTYLIRVLPLTLIHPPPDSKPYHPLVFVLYALRNLGRYDFPGHPERNRYPVVGSRRLNCRRCDGMARLLAVHRRKRRLRRRVCRRMRLIVRVGFPPAGDKRVRVCDPARSSRAGWSPSADGEILF